MLEGIICPICETTLEEHKLRAKLKCPSCKTDLKQRIYLDFLEYLMKNGIVENLDFFDPEVYQEDIERLSPDDEEDIDPSEFEKKRDTFNLYENEVIPQKDDSIDEDTAFEKFEGLNEDWEEFNLSDFE
ncbi:MAG: hypothetical protein HQ509_04900 [Candidatus Marinimicrobia bacterium]|nr:hypothetical protein [Candidatus Neomarinimicrobiota bacterium]